MSSKLKDNRSTPDSIPKSFALMCREGGSKQDIELTEADP